MIDYTERAQAGCGFWLLWALASTAGLALGFSVSFAALETLGKAMANAMAVAVVGAGIGASVGTAQWLVLRRQVSRAGWWALASAVGLAVGFAVAFAVVEATDESEAVGFAVAGMVGGASVGTAQWIILRRKVSRAGWWALASTVSLALAFVVVEAVPYARTLTVAGAAGGAVYGVITGDVLILLLRQPTSDKLGPSQATN